MGSRIARMREVVAALYERIKEERAVLDQLDLLVKLRDLLRDERDARRQLQALFDHIFVDEFQDTDPLQCEIVFFLSEMGADAPDWRSVRLRPGSLTVVGDPKQSIYRFRRADIAMYEAAHDLLRRQGALVTSLTTNFRSRPRLIDFVNRQFCRLLGEATGPARFQAATGRVLYERLDKDRGIADGGPAVDVVPIAGPAGARFNAPEGRAIEAGAIARRIRWLVASRFRVREADADTERDLRYGDIAVLAHVTMHVPLLLRALDALGIRYSTHGGTLFLSSPLVRLYLMGLRHVVDRDDGVAEAALLRPPFFGLDLLDLVSPRLDGAEPSRRARLDEARELVQSLRRDRLSRPPIDTAVDLIERTALGRFAATGPNGRQALEMLYEVAFQLGRRAAELGLDYDGVTREMRAWVDHPIKLDPPDGADPDTVRVMTIHQAKGLEFPVVALWDGFAEKAGRIDGCWTVSRTADGIALSMYRLEAEMPAGSNLLAHEKLIATAERERLFYVAMTRARDLLVVPEPAVASSPGGKMVAAIMKDVAPEVVSRAEPYRPDMIPAWAQGEVARSELVADPAAARRFQDAERAFQDALAVAGAPIAVPTAITRAARAAAGPPEEEDDVEEAPCERVRKAERSRFGATFGSTVHRAIELALAGCGPVPELVARAAREHGLGERLEEARADVERALAFVGGLGAGELRSEYPVCVAGEGTLLVGFIDLLGVRDGEVVVIDFKSDAPPGAGVSLAAYPEYRGQLGLYERALRATGLVGERRVRVGLVFTGSGDVVWG